jgi:hypothetical protein
LIPEDKWFYFTGGKKASTIEELKEVLHTISDSEFVFHVNAGKNDFANWVEGVFGEKDLADDMRHVLEKKDTSAVLARFLKSREPKEHRHEEHHHEKHAHGPVQKAFLQEELPVFEFPKEIEDHSGSKDSAAERKEVEPKVKEGKREGRKEERREERAFERFDAAQETGARTQELRPGKVTLEEVAPEKDLNKELAELPDLWADGEGPPGEEHGEEKGSEERQEETMAGGHPEDLTRQVREHDLSDNELKDIVMNARKDFHDDLERQDHAGHGAFGAKDDLIPPVRKHEEHKFIIKEFIYGFILGLIFGLVMLGVLFNIKGC